MQRVGRVCKGMQMKREGMDRVGKGMQREGSVCKGWEGCAKCREGM